MLISSYFSSPMYLSDSRRRRLVDTRDGGNFQTALRIFNATVTKIAEIEREPILEFSLYRVKSCLECKNK